MSLQHLLPQFAWQGKEITSLLDASVKKMRQGSLDTGLGEQLLGRACLNIFSLSRGGAWAEGNSLWPQIH